MSVACLRFSRMGSVKCQKDGEVPMAGLVENSPGPPEWLLLVGAGVQGGGSGRLISYTDDSSCATPLDTGTVGWGSRHEATSTHWLEAWRNPLLLGF